MNAEQLYSKLKPIQEKKGLLFNRDREQTLALLEALLLNKDRYGYMSCPCRLASGTIESDRDIICPCDYCQPDIEEFGSCFCSLYVSKEWNEGVVDQVYVPERRSPDKTDF